MKRQETMGYQTEQRKKLYALLRENPHAALSVKEIFSALEGEGISISAIYRNLSAMTKEGLVRRSIRSGSREALYQFVGCEGCRNELHLTCTGCGKTFHMDHELARTVQESVRQTSGFQIDNTKTSLYGVCRTCGMKSAAGDDPD